MRLGEGPELADENFEAWVLWNEVKTQWRSTAFDLIGLDYNAVAAEAKRLDIELTQCTMKKIKALEENILSRQKKGNDNREIYGSKKAL